MGLIEDLQSWHLLLMVYITSAFHCNNLFFHLFPTDQCFLDS